MIAVPDDRRRHARDLIPGKRYEIVIYDCCVTATIADALFVEQRPFDDGGDMFEYFDLIFDGIIIDHWSACSFFERPD